MVKDHHFVVRSLAVSLLIALLTGCLGDDDEDLPDYETQLATDVAIIDAYLADSVQAQTDPSGLRYVVHAPGDTARPAPLDTVLVSYATRYLPGGGLIEAFDSVAFVRVDLIDGWQIGLSKVGQGGSLTLHIPSGLAYGPFVRGIIPPNSNLEADVNVIEIRRQ